MFSSISASSVTRCIHVPLQPVCLQGSGNDPSFNLNKLILTFADWHNGSSFKVRNSCIFPKQKKHESKKKHAFSKQISHCDSTFSQVSISVSTISGLEGILALVAFSPATSWISDNWRVGSGALQYWNELYWKHSSASFGKRTQHNILRYIITVKSKNKPSCKRNWAKLF